MKVILIDPPGRSFGASVALAYLAGVLKKNKHSVKVIDLNNRIVSNIDETIKKELIEFKPDLVGLTLLSLTYYESMKILSGIKKYYAGPIVVGGPQTFIEQEKLLENKDIDIVVIGEGEDTIIDLLNALKGKKELKTVPGIIFRDKKDHPVKTEKRQLIKDLDTIPFPDYESLGIENFGPKGKNTYTILTSRGCPYNCSFCYSPALSGRSWRGRKPEKIIEELKQATQKFGCDSFQIGDDNFTLNMARAERICDLLIENKINMNWHCMARADRVNESLIKKMKAAGCQSVQMGVESLIPEIFNEIDKGESIEDIRKAADLFKKYGIKTYSFFIIGLPKDTFKGVMKSYNLSKKMGFDFNSWQNMMPLPNTRVWDWVNANGTMIKDYKSQSSILEIGFETPEFTKEERQKAFEIISTKEKAYPFDPQKSNFLNGINILKLIIKHDIWHLPAHIYKIIVKTAEILLRGKKEVLGRMRLKV